MDNPIASLSPSPGADPLSDKSDLTGRTIGEFKVLRRLGQGGMGQVYLAEQVSLKRKVALKLLKPELAANEISLKRFESEGHNAARITHAHIVQIYGIGEWEGLHYMALEYVEGLNLREYLVKKGPPELPLALSIMRQVASALAEAAEQNIVHRDIKPENILLTRKGQVKVADFGLARCFAPDQQTLHLTQSGVTMGTPLYMSPEQVQNRATDSRTDIYSFGVTCYHMLAGEPPFKGDTPFEVALQHVQSEAKPLGEIRPDLPPEACAVVHKMMAKEPSNRYQTARELLQDIQRLRNSLTGSLKGKTGSISLIATDAEPLMALEEDTRQTPKPRRWLPWTVTATIVLALVGGAIVGWSHNQPPASSTSMSPSKEIVVPAPSPGADSKLSLQEKEQRLRQAAKDYENPGNDRAIGVSHQVELAVFLLDQRRFDEADRFFKQLTDNPQRVPMYVLLGKLGHGVVLAFQDKAEESTKLLADLFTEKPNKMMLRAVINLMNNYPHLRLKVAEAIQRNKYNKQEIPAVLEKVGQPNQPLVTPPDVKPKQKEANKGVG
jgi:eukaryotic-like serine/threonine-protein kinase